MSAPPVATTLVTRVNSDLRRPGETTSSTIAELEATCEEGLGVAEKILWMILVGEEATAGNDADIGASLNYLTR